MSILRNKRVVVLGLGNHGGGVASAQFACYCGAAQVFISDMQSEEKLKTARGHLKNLLCLPHVQLETGRHSVEKILSADIVIKNPAIPRGAPIIRACIERGVSIETDISLFLRALIAEDQTCTAREPREIVAVTGTKGKSSLVHAINTWNVQRNLPSFAAGNIAYSPLKILMDDGAGYEARIVLELSSFQLGDLQLVWQNNAPFSSCQAPHLAMLTNVLPDHQNYYASMREYVEDKFSLFRSLSPQTLKIMPYELRASAYGDMLPMLQTPRENGIIWHSQSPLPEHETGAWAEKDAIVVRRRVGEKPQKCCALSAIPACTALQNCIAFALFCAVQGYPCPQTTQAWEGIFTMAHRKEYVRNYKGRVFYNDSAASIPQAMQLRSLHKAAGGHVHLIAGGTDKNLDAQSFLIACSALGPAHLTLHFLEGTYTEKILPHFSGLSYGVFGPFSSLEQGVQSAFKRSKAGDLIVLSPGCTSFGLFTNEFERGEVFKEIVRAL